MTCIFRKVLLFVTLVSTSSSSSKILCVDNFENSCLQCDVNVTMNESLQEYLNKYNTSTIKEIILCSTEVHLQASITLKNVSFVSIDSYFESSTISCTKGDFGISFVNGKNITLRNIEMQRCGDQYYGTSYNTSARDTYLFFQTSLYFLNSSNISISGLFTVENHGIGLTLINCNGSVTIQDSRFEKNFVDTTEAIPGGGGLYIEFNYTPAEKAASYYTLTNCSFKENTAHSISTSYKHTSKGHFQGLGRGGGLCIHFRRSTKKIIVKILDCTFFGNKAIWGGGMYLVARDAAEANEVSIDRATFSNNICTLHGGGGLGIGFLSNGSHQPTNNKIVIWNSLFHNNQAEHGGGTLVYSTFSLNINLENSIEFASSIWEGNKAIFGAAVTLNSLSWFSLNKGTLPTPIFTDCSFISNVVDNKLDIANNYSIQGKGAFAAVNMDMTFKGMTTFTNNSNTALYLVSSNAKFRNGSDVVFQGNDGKIGGAVVIASLGSIEINDNSYFSFINNTAREKGGAIYQASHDINDFAVSRICFIQYEGSKDNVSERDIHFTFIGNKAGIDGTVYLYGNSIFASTLRFCFTGCLKQPKSYNETFDCIASFTFDGDINHQISTIGAEISLNNKTSTLHPIPGGRVVLPLTLHDELDNEISKLYHVYLWDNTNLTMSLADKFISEKWIQVFGKPDDRALLRIETLDIWEVVLSFPIKMSHCPPGFSLAKKLHNGRNVSHCQCEANSNKLLYDGIIDCNENSFVATMRRGFWYGYDKHEESDRGFSQSGDLVSGHCPLRYCKLHENSTVLLPNNTNISELDLLVCGSRTGRLCASCRGNRSTLFHSNSFECSPSETCKYGLLLYLLADILPITIFFFIVIFFDVSFTHGAINGLIFYFQVTDISTHVTSGFVRCKSFPTHLQEIYALLSGPFNLKFFYHPNMSFCLWHEFQTLNILAFRYVSIVYALSLVIAIISIKRAFGLKRIGRKLPKLLGKSFNVKTTVIHGLSGFLVICYSECSKISLLILTPTELYYTSKNRTVVLLNGELDYFKGRHLIYALPAVFFLIVMGLIPPLLFISYPLCYRIFALLRINESLFTKTLCRIFPFERFRPFFDSFQSSFKDEYRFYSGLYFLYRMITLLTFVATRSITIYLIVLLVEFTIILCLHATIQPYKNRWHNIADGFIFTNLIILTALTLLNYRSSLEYYNTSHVVEQICVFRTLFLCAPMAAFLILVVTQIVRKLKLSNIVRKPNAIGYRDQELSESLLFARRDSVLSESTSCD